MKNNILYLVLWVFFLASFSYADLDQSDEVKEKEESSETYDNDEKEESDEQEDKETAVKDEEENKSRWRWIWQEVSQAARETTWRMNERVHEIKEERWLSGSTEELKEKAEEVKEEAKSRLNSLSASNKERVVEARDAFSSTLDNITSSMDESELSDWIETRMDRVEAAIENFETNDMIPENQRNTSLALLEEVYDELNLRALELQDDLDLDEILEDIIE